MAVLSMHRGGAEARSNRENLGEIAMPAQRGMRCFGLVVLFALLLTGCQQDRTKALVPADAVPATSTTLYLDPPQLDLGEVDGSKPIQATLLLRNISDHATMVGSVQSSCGCTNARLESTLLPPQGFSPLHVTIDPFAKRGEVHKLVTITDQTGAVTRSTITMRVRPSTHAMGIDPMGLDPGAHAMGIDPIGAHAMGKRESLFAGKCAKCHAAPARGLRQGKAIYRAVCIMCHGKNGKGGYAPALKGKRSDALFAIITHGAGNPAMPAFAREHGGPLSPAQIRALTSWLSHGAH
ncbi:MAG: c-type cytochrome [Mariprofundales bacterium]|nr:c-type cytochrome [Mariprofundales bacterium]